MNANATVTARVVPSVKATARDTERGHRIRLFALYAMAIAINLAIFIYGFDYYKLSAIDRPFSPKHHLLRPSGPVGLYLGFVGVALFVGIFLYPIRKHWPWLCHHWKYAPLARHPRPHGSDGPGDCRVSLDFEIQGPCGHGFLDHVRCLRQRSCGSLFVRADSS